MAYRFERTIGGRNLSLETGELAGLASGSVLVRYGDVVVLATACVSQKPREGIDFFPLTVDFEERLYAVGRSPAASSGAKAGPAPRASSPAA